MTTNSVFSTISPASTSSPPSGYSTVGKDDILSSFTTLGDEVHDQVAPAPISKGKAEMPTETNIEAMITPPMSQKEQEINTPVSSSGKAKISRNEFVDSLISAASILLELIWPKNFDSVQIKWFLKETLRRSRSSYCTLQVALYYIYKLKPIIQSSKSAVFICPKRCFLTCLITASKFLQDRNYSMKNWSKMSGLPLKDLISMEFQVLKAIDYDLNLHTSLYSEWSKLLLICTYVNNTTDQSLEESKKTSATLFVSKKQRLAQIFRRFNAKVMVKSTNATSLSVVHSSVDSNNNAAPLKRKRVSADEDVVVLAKLQKN